MTPSKEVLRPADLVPLLGVSRSRVYQMLREGFLPGIRQGRAILIPRVAWEKWLSKQSEKALASAGADSER